MKIEISPPYVPMIQKPNCCNAACLQMILIRRGFGYQSQDHIASKLGTKIKATEKDTFMVKLEVAEEGEELGVQTVDSEDTINNFFESFGFPLRAKAYRASEIPSVSQFIIDNLKNGNDLWVEFHLDEREKGHHTIHDNLVKDITLNLEGYFVITIDPWWTFKQEVKWPLEMLERSIGTKYGRECGFIVVSAV